MRKSKILIMILVLAITSTCFGAVRISHRTVQPARALARLLNDRIGTLDDQVATLQALATGGVYDNIGTGDVFYVDSVTGSDTDTGVTWALALATLDKAFDKVTDGNHDVIYIASVHAEDMSTTTLDKDDVTVIGIGSGVDMPEFTFNSTADEFVVDAQGITVYNLRFIPGIADVTAAFDLQDESDYFTLIGCEFVEPATDTFDFTVGLILVAGADNVTIAYNSFVNQGANPGTTTFIELGATAITGLSVIGNYVNADMSVAAVFSDQADINLTIANNTFIQEDTAQPCIQLTGAATGLISNNLLCNLGGIAYLLDPGSCHLDRNRANIAIDSASFPFPLEPAEGRTAGTGIVIYVDSGTPGAGDGRSWGTALATLDAGIDKCTAGDGDTIYVAAGHSETGGDVDADRDDITIIGLGSGNNRPLIDFDGTSDVFKINADNIHIKNIRFQANVATVDIAIEIETGAENWIIEDCVFDMDAANTDYFDDVIEIAALSHGGTIKNCQFYQGTGTSQAAINFLNCDYVRIIGNEFYGDYAVACIENTVIGVHVTIKDNILFNGTVNGTSGLNAQPCIELHTDTSGTIVNNQLFCNEASAAAAIVADECFLSGNTYNEVAGSGTSLVVGQTYTFVSSEATAAQSTVQLFDVAGGPIEIISMFGEVVTVMASNPGDMNLEIDADSADWDADFTTAVTVDSMTVGDIIVMGAITAGENALDMVVNVSAGYPISWYCPTGDIEQALTTSSGSGGTVWYMTFRPLVDGVIVTVY